MADKKWYPSPLATKKLLKLLTIIKAEPRRFHMRQWFKFYNKKFLQEFLTSYPEEKLKTPPCGTVACIAGWLTIIDKKVMGKPKLIAKLEEQWAEPMRPIPNIFLLEINSAVKDAIKALEIKGPDRYRIAEILFDNDGWPEPFCSKFINHPQNIKEFRLNAEVTHRFIHHIIENGLEY